MSEVYLGFDFGFKRIGVAAGQKITCSARPVTTLSAHDGVPDWKQVAKLIREWSPEALIVGIPVQLDGTEQYTAPAARQFSQQLATRFYLPVHWVDERLTTVEARAELFAQGGYRNIKKTQVDSIAACIILEQWLQHPQEFS